MNRTDTTSEPGLLSIPGRGRQPDAVARLPRGAWWSRMVPKQQTAPAYSLILSDNLRRILLGGLDMGTIL